MSELRVGSTVTVPWGVADQVDGEIVDVWGDPPRQFRVRLDLDDDDAEESVILLLPSSVVQAA